MANIEQRVILKFKDPEFPERFRDLLLSTGKVKVQGIGIFEVRGTKARRMRSISSGHFRTQPAHNRIVFRPTKDLKAAVQKTL